MKHLQSIYTAIYTANSKKMSYFLRWAWDIHWNNSKQQIWEVKDVAFITLLEKPSLQRTKKLKSHPKLNLVNTFEE